jgi:heat shock protein HslJ
MLHIRQMRVALIALAAVLTACSGFGEVVAPSNAETEQPGDRVDLDGTEWVLISLNGNSLIEGSNITLDFTEGQVSGFAGCNWYGGKHTGTDKDPLAIAEMAVTAQLCPAPEGVMQQETAYTEALQNAAACRVVDDRLEIDNAAGETTLVFARKADFPMNPDDLVGTRWRLISMDGRSLIEGSTITLAFHDENQVSGSAGCRGYVATYEASGDDMRFLWLAMLEAHCLEQDALLEQEAQYTTILEGASDYRLSEDQLDIFTARGEVLVFEPLPEGADASLEGTTWAFSAFIEEKTIEGMAAPLLIVTGPLAKTEITATFDDGTVSGSAGCNTYHAAYTSDGPSLTLETLTATEIACRNPAGIMEQEQRYLGFLKDVTIHRIYGSQLWLETGDGGILVFNVQE